MTSAPFWTRPAELILWTQLVSSWVLCTYWVAPETPVTRAQGLARRQTSRTLLASVCAAVAAAALPAAGAGASARLLLAALLAGTTFGATYGRARLARSSWGKRWMTEWEISLLAWVVVLTALAVSSTTVPAPSPYDLSRSGKAAALLVVISAACFALRGGTYLVRGMLDKTGAKPTVRLPTTAPPPHAADPLPASAEALETAAAIEGAKQLDVPELNRGRSIGNLERLLMLMVIGLGSYEALGFLIAAKGLIRAREFEDRNFAEYFILGSLTSAAVALPLGVLLRVAVPILWSL